MVKGIVITVLNEREIASVAPPPREIIAVMERTYRDAAAGKVEVPTKIGVHPDFPSSFCHAMPAWVEGERALGMKWISYYPGNMKRGLPDSTGIVILNDPDTGLPTAVMEGMWITYARTAACAAVAARYLANPNPTRLGLIGCGGLGTWSLRMLSEIFPSLREVKVASSRKESRVEFCRKMAEQGPWSLTPVERVEDAVRDMDIVISSISKTSEPPGKEVFWTPGTLVIPLDVIGGWDNASFERANRLVSDGFDALARSAERSRPDLKLPQDRHVRLEDVVAGKAIARTSPNDRIMGIPTGVASVDMTLGWEIFRRASAARLGVTIPLT
jgi:alanine dehydrogenase